MPLEALILRRVFPVPVTFADLRQAFSGMLDSVISDYNAHRDLMKPIDERWHAAIKEATGALDEVYAVIDGREVRVATVNGACEGAYADSPSVNASQVNALLINADEAGYWQRPHEVRVDLDEHQMSHRTMARIAAASIAIAGSK